MNATQPQTGRLNLRALILTAVGLAAILGGCVWLKGSEARRLRRGVLIQAERALKAGRGEKALRHLNRFLESSPADVAALELKARLLAESAQGGDQLREAAQVNDFLLRVDPEGVGRDETRRRLADLYIRYSDAIRESDLAQTAPEMAARETRYQGAEALAREMIRRNPADGTAHRLLGMAITGRSGSGDAEAAASAARAFATALRLDPRDAVAAGRLADLERGTLKDPAAADRVLDALKRAAPERLDVRIARFRHFDRFGDQDRAAAELSEAILLAPGDSGVRLTGAEYAVRRGDTKEARRQIDAIPADAREGLRARLVRGMIDMAERRPEDAVEAWRAGLASTGGTDAELNWWLAYVLLRMDRAAEARPLVEQYRRLVGDDEKPQARILRALLDEKADRPLAAIANLETLTEKVGEPFRPILLQALGRCYEAVWDERQALASYRAAAEAAPADPSPRLAVARLLAVRQPEDALAYLRREAEPGAADPALKLALAGVLLGRQARLPAARRTWAEVDAALARAAAAAPEAPALPMLRADRRSLSGDLAGAIAQLRDATRAAPRDPSAWIAYAGAVERQGKAEEAVRALEAASGPEAAGDRAAIRIALARLLTSLGRGREARDRLARDADHLSPADRASVQEELGRLLAAQGDPAAAQAAFAGWARLAPESPQPRLAALDLALATGDDALIRSTVAGLRELGGSKDILGRLCRVVEILRATAAARDPSARAADPATAEAEALLAEVRKAAPEVPSVALLQGQLLDGLGRIDQAAAEYRRAWDRGLEDALPRLIALLVRHRRVDDLAALRRDRADDPRLERLLAQAARQLGDARSVEALLGASGPDRAAIPEAQVDRAQALAAAGKVAEAEAILLARAEGSGGAEAPWLDLLRFRAQHDRDDAVAATIQTIKSKVKSRRPEVLEAGCLGIVGDRAGADRAIAAALKSYPDDPDVLVAAAGVARANGRTAEAIARLRRVVELDPKQVTVGRQLAVTLAQAARDPAGWEQAWALVGPESADPEARLVRAFVLIRCPDPERRRGAIPLLEALIGDLNADQGVARAARDYLVRMLLGEKQIDRACRVAAVSATRGFDPAAIGLYVEALLLKRDFAQARTQLDRWLAAAPGDRREAALRARLIVQETPPGEAAAALERAYLDRGDGPAAEAMGAAAFQALLAMGPGAAPGAARVADRLAAGSPAQSWAAARLAARDGRRDEAYRLARAAIDSGAAPGIVEAARAAMVAASAPGADGPALDGAWGVLEAALKRQPRAPDLLVMAGVLRHLQGRYDDEAALYRAALAVQPSHVIARNNLAWVVAEDQGRPAEGLPLIDALIRDEGPDADRLGTRGVTLLRLGRQADALRDLEEAARLRPSALHSYYLALAYRKSGRAADARRNLDAAIRAGLSPAEIDAPQRAEYRSLVSAEPSR